MKSLQWISASLSCLLCTALVTAQTPSSGGIVSGTGGGGTITVQTSVGPAGVGCLCTKGLPYSADVVRESDRVLADGNRIHTETHGKAFRDGEGRTRNENEFETNGIKLTYVNIVDPVQRIEVYINPQTKTATVNHVKISSPLPADRVPAPATMPAKPSSTVTSEELGSREIEGILTFGTRHRQTFEPGSVGNERAFSVVSEIWRSRDLNIAVLNTKDDPRSGHETMRLTNIQTVEPDPLLFQVPPDYTVKDNP